MIGPRGGRAGFTLIEMLIAVTLVGLIAAGMLTAISVALKTMERTDARVSEERRVASVQHILEQQIAGLMPVAAFCVSPGGQSSARVPLFQGLPGSMRFVSSYSLDGAERGTPRILEYLVIPGDQGVGVRLVVNEILYTGPESAGASCVAPDADPAHRFAPVQAGPNSFVLADKLAYCRISYQESLNYGRDASWTPVWDKQKLPSGIRVEMAPLDPASARLPLMSVTVPIRVTRDVLGIYSDYADYQY